MTQSETPPVAEPGSEAPAFRRMADRFRGYLPVVVDVETGGFDWQKARPARTRRRPDRPRRTRPLHPRRSRELALHPGARPGDRPEVARNHRHRARPPLPLRQAGEGRPRPRLRRRARRGAQTQLPARDPGRPQRALRPQLPQRRRRARAAQAQPLPPLQRVRHGDAGRRGLRADRAGARGAGRGHRLERRRSALGGVRRGEDRGVVLQGGEQVGRSAWGAEVRIRSD